MAETSNKIKPIKHKPIKPNFIDEIEQKIGMLLKFIKSLVTGFFFKIFSILGDKNLLKKLTNPLLLSNAFYLILKVAQETNVFDKLLKKHDDDANAGNHTSEDIAKAEVDGYKDAAIFFLASSEEAVRKQFSIR